MSRLSRPEPKKAKAGVVALALTWDGARWPIRSLPLKAREFLVGKERKISAPSAKAVSRLVSGDEVREIRICWVPRLKGGADVLAESFSIASEKRLAFKATKVMRMGDYLGVVYRR